MNHLTDAELVDHLDNALPLARRTHLQNCERCRAHASEMDSVLARAVENRGVPEPSPLFWDHLSTRVRDAVAAAPTVPSWRELVWRPSTAWAAGLASVALAVAISHSMLPRAPLSTPSSIVLKAPAVAGASAAGPELADDIEADDAWAVVRNVADQVEWSDAHDAGISTRPDAAERITAELTNREQSELARLLQHELNQRSVREGRSVRE
jgi:hypothetical protein